MYSLVYDHNSKAPDGTAPSQYPADWRPITEKEFAQGQFRIINRIRFIEHRIDATLFWFYDGTGVAICPDYWSGKVAYYAFGCNHQYTELTLEECNQRGIPHLGNCYHVEVCKNCERINTRDSSD